MVVMKILCDEGWVIVFIIYKLCEVCVIVDDIIVV